MMKRFYSQLLIAVLTLTTTVGFAQGGLIFTGMLDGPLTGGLPKAIEIYVVDDIDDMSLYGIAKAANGAASPGAPSYTFPAGTAEAGTFIYLSVGSAEFETYFGFAPDYAVGDVVNNNGDDAMELYYDGTAYENMGEVGVDGTGDRKSVV